MSNKEYAFQIRDDGSLKCLPLSTWQRVLNKTSPLQNARNTRLNFAEISLQKNKQQNTDVRRVRLWTIEFNEQGFAERQEWKMSERPDINTLVGKLFQDNNSHNDVDNLMDQFIDGIVNVNPLTHQLNPATYNSTDMEELFVNNLLAR